MSHPEDPVTRLKEDFTRAVILGTQFEMERLLSQKIALKNGQVFNLDINSDDNQLQLPPLHILVRYKRGVHAMQFLVDQGADIQRTDKNRATALHQVAKRDTDQHSGESDPNDVRVVRFLVGNGVNTEQRDNQGRTALHIAAQTDNIFVVRQLEQEKADRNARDDQGRTPLHLAVLAFTPQSRITPETFEFLLKSGADVTVRDNHGLRAIDYARKSEGIKKETLALFEKLAHARLEEQETRETREHAQAAQEQRQKNLGRLDKLLDRKKKPGTPPA